MEAGEGSSTSAIVVTAMGAIVLATLLAAAHLVYYKYWSYNPGGDGGRRLPPGSRGLPFIGESLGFFTSSPSLELVPFLKRRLERYGPIFRTNLMGQDLIVSMDQDLNNLVFHQEEKQFQIWYPESFMRIMGADNIISTLGSFHKHVRSLVLRLFGPENLRLVLLHDVHATANATLLSWLHQPSIELKHELSSMIFSVTSKTLISYDSSSIDGNLWKQFDAFTRGLLAFPIYIPGTSFYQCIQGRKYVMKILKELLEERRKTAEDEPRSKIDFLDLLIEDLKGEKPVMSEKVALDLVFPLLFGAFETTTSGITAALRFLTDNPKALQELTEEHDNIRNRRADPDYEVTWEEYKSMKFTSHVIHETLRLANIAPVVFRKALEDVHVKGYTIPKGSKIMITPSNVHLNPAVYKDPNTFNPWRWKDTVQRVIGGVSKDFMAFGGGLRLCAGAEFAKLQMAIFLHCLVTKYRWKAIKGGTMVLSPGLRFPDGFHIQLIQRDCAET